MSGAGRSERQRRQAEAQARLAAAGIQVPKKSGSSRTPMIMAAVALVVVVAAVLVYYLVVQKANGNTAAPTYTAKADGAVVTAGSGPVVVDTYEDFLCPECERFEARYGDQIVAALNANQITVKFHTIAILDSKSTPAGYSTRAADAALCSVASGAYPKMRQQLFVKQPAEGSAGLSDADLVTMGQNEGAGADFAACVNGTGNDAAIAKETAAASKNKALQNSAGQFGTPTITVNGKQINVNDTAWLQNAIAGK
jgi:protein-disulfide isomerase